METYSIYCTESQTKKALELGAPIEICDTEVDIENRNIGYSIGHEGFLCEPAKIENYLYDEDGNRKEYNVLIDGTEETGRIVAFAPTAEQMTGWLRSKGFRFRITEFEEGTLWKVAHGDWFAFGDDDGVNPKEATLAAIDAALEHLMNKKK